MIAIILPWLHFWIPIEACVCVCMLRRSFVPIVFNVNFAQTFKLLLIINLFENVSSSHFKLKTLTMLTIWSGISVELYKANIGPIFAWTKLFTSSSGIDWLYFTDQFELIHTEHQTSFESTEIGHFIDLWSKIETSSNNLIYKVSYNIHACLIGNGRSLCVWWMDERV